MLRGFLVATSLVALMTVAAQAVTLNEAIQRAWQSPTLFHRQLEADQRLYDIAKIERWQRLLPNEPQVFYGNTDDRTSEVYGVTETFWVSRQGAGLSDAGPPPDGRRARGMGGPALRSDASRRSVLSGQRRRLGHRRAAEAHIQDAETLASSLRARYEAGLAAQAEVISSDLQIRQQRADLAAAEDNAAVSLSKLKKTPGSGCGPNAPGIARRSGAGDGRPVGPAHGG